jgi:hypothetical protein
LSSGSGSALCKSTLNLTVEHHRRVFVVAEWDDSHIYHTLLGEPTLLVATVILIPSQRSSQGSSTTKNSYSHSLTLRSWCLLSLSSPSPLPLLCLTALPCLDHSSDAMK